MSYLLYSATPTTFNDDSFVFIYAGNYRLRLSGRRRQLMAKSDHAHSMHCSSSSLNECFADLRLQLLLGRPHRAFGHRYENPPFSRHLSMMNGTGLRQYTQKWLVLMDMPFCGRPRKPRPLIRIVTRFATSMLSFKLLMMAIDNIRHWECGVLVSSPFTLRLALLWWDLL